MSSYYMRLAENKDRFTEKEISNVANSMSNGKLRFPKQQPREVTRAKKLMTMMRKVARLSPSST